MENTNVVDLTEFVSPIDPNIRRRFESKLREYENRLKEPGEPWLVLDELRRRHDEFEKFRDLLYKSFIVNELVTTKPGEKIPIVRLLKGLGELGVEPDRRSFEEAVMSVYMRLTGELPLPP